MEIKITEYTADIGHTFSTVTKQQLAAKLVELAKYNLATKGWMSVSRQTHSFWVDTNSLGGSPHRSMSIKH